MKKPNDQKSYAEAFDDGWKVAESAMWRLVRAESRDSLFYGFFWGVVFTSFIVWLLPI